MATEKTASVKLNLNGSSYLVELKNLGKENDETARKVESAWKKSGVAGLKAFGKELGDTVSSVKSAIKTVATFGGAFSFAAAAKGAVDAQAQFKNLSFAIKAGTDEMVNWQDLQKDAQGTALAWGQSSRDLGKTYHDLFEELGDVGLAKIGMEQASLASRATGKSVESLANIAGVLGEKFSVTGEQMPEAMAAVISLGNKGGISIEQMGEKLGLLGASARAAGLQGQAGFESIVGMANVADNAMGSFKKSLGAVTGLLDTFGTPEQAKKISSVFGVAVKDAKGNARELTTVMGEIFRATGGKREKLALGFQGEQLKLVVELGKIYSDAFSKTTGSIKTKTDAALAAYESAVKKAGASNLTAAQLQAEANERMKDPQARLAQSLEKLEQAFTKPKMLAAIDQLSQQLPELAEKLANLVGFVLENPGTSAAVAAGVKLGGPALQAALVEGGKTFAKNAADVLRTGGSGPGAGGGAVGALGRTAAVATAAFAGYELGELVIKKIIDPVITQDTKTRDNLVGATVSTEAATTGRIDPEQAKKSLELLRERLDKAKEGREFQASDVYTLGLRRIGGTASDKEVGKAQEAYDKGMAAVAAAEAARKLDDVTDAAQSAAGALRSITGGATGGGPAYRGPLRPDAPRPGYGVLR